MEVFSAITLGIVLASCCVIRFYTNMVKGSATINALFPHKIACVFALGLYLVLGMTSSVIQGFFGVCLKSISWTWLSEENPKLTVT